MKTISIVLFIGITTTMLIGFIIVMQTATIIIAPFLQNTIPIVAGETDIMTAITQAVSVHAVTLLS